MKRTRFGIIAFAFLLWWSPVLRGMAQGVTSNPTLNPGTMIKASLQDELSSSASSPGDSFFLRVVFATDGGKHVSLPRETKLRGEVIKAKSALRDRAGFLTLQLKQIVFPDGKSQPISGDLQFLMLENVTTEVDGQNLSLRGRVEESDKMTIKSSTSDLPPPANNNDVSQREIKSPEQRARESTGALEISKKKGHDVVIAADTSVNVKVAAPPVEKKTAPAAH